MRELGQSRSMPLVRRHPNELGFQAPFSFVATLQRKWGRMMTMSGVLWLGWRTTRP